MVVTALVRSAARAARCAPEPHQRVARGAARAGAGRPTRRSLCVRAEGHARPPAHVEEVTSTKNPYVKHCVKLRRNATYRADSGTALLTGLAPIRELAAAGLLNIRVLISSGQAATADIPAAQRLQVSDAVMERLAGLEGAGGGASGGVVAAEVELPSPAALADRLRAPPPHGLPSHRLLALDSVQDPGNMGTLLRTACGLGWSGAFLLPGCCDPWNDKALRAARGATFRLPLATGGWDELEAVLGGDAVMLAADVPRAGAGAAPSLRAVAAGSAPVCLVLGSEGQGLSEAGRRRCAAVGVPMLGDMESLNVAAAGAILMHSLGPVGLAGLRGAGSKA
ncbi:unnamed protein product [Pedinophyceae sp. YPF-701]|nr:unnamed protein product [Pedinophyceae sp. YPF-701]